MSDKICLHCAYVGKPVTKEHENFWTDLFAWGLFLSIAGMSQDLYLLLVPLSWTVFHIIKSKSACPKCKTPGMVNLQAARIHKN
ncbi:MAG: hypothetical protein R3240_00275 [Gammaproteobacteria bacterium]|nr:hypothetical protein [Gammaproteobacteria bacterium]